MELALERRSHIKIIDTGVRGGRRSASPGAGLGVLLQETVDEVCGARKLPRHVVVDHSRHPLQGWVRELFEREIHNIT